MSHSSRLCAIPFFTNNTYIYLMKNTLVVLSFLCLYVCAEAQWSRVNTVANFQSSNVAMLTPARGFLAYANGLQVTNDGGLNWTAASYAQTDSIYYHGMAINALYFFDAYTGVAVGFSTFDMKAAVIRTTDGGHTWSTPYLGGTNHEFLDVSFADANNSIAVGDGGTMARSTDGGLNWLPVLSGTTGNLYHVRFDPGSPSIGLANCIDSLILRTTDAGATWSPAVFSGEIITDVKYAAPGVAYATGVNHPLYKTTDSGITWDSVPCNLPFSNDFQFTATDTAYAAGAGIYRTVNSGVTWEKAPGISLTTNFLYFYNGQLGFCGGYNDIVYRTTNQGGTAWGPQAKIWTTGAYTCYDSLFHYYTSAGQGYTYRWYLNSTLISTASSDSAIMHGRNITDTLSLIVSNGYYSDTSRLYFFANGPLPFNLAQPRSTSDTLCFGSSVNIYVDSTQYDITYQLLNGSQAIGAAQHGNLGTLTFSVPGGFDSTITYTIVATRTTGCGTYQTSKNLLLTTGTPWQVPMVAAPSAICSGDTARVQIQQSQGGYMYTFYFGGNTPPFVPNGTGGTISIDLPNLVNNDSFWVAAYGPTGCQKIFYNYIHFTTRHMELNVGNIENVDTGQNIQLRNYSNGDAYYWTFDSTANELTDTATQPAFIAYSTTGDKEVKMVGTTVEGCLDSVTFRERVNLPVDTSAPGQVCMLDTIASNGLYNIMAYHVDRFGNQYVAGYTFLQYYYSDYEGGSYYYFLQKFDKQGQLLWEKKTPYTQYDLFYFSTYVTGITSDPYGNVYVCGNYGTDNFIFDTYSEYLNNADGFFVASFDTLGVLKWLTHSTCSSCSESVRSYVAPADIQYVDAGHLYLSLNGKQSSDGLEYSDGGTKPMSDIFVYVLQLDNAGHYQRKWDFTPDVGSSTTSLLGTYQPPNAASDPAWYTAVSPKIHPRSDGKIDLVGEFTSFMRIGDTLLLDRDSSSYSSKCGFLAVLDTVRGFTSARLTYHCTGGRIVSFNASILNNAITPVDVLDANDNLYVAVRLGLPNYPFDSIILPNGNVITDTGIANCIIKYDKAGNMQWAMPSFINDVRGLAVSDNNDTLYIYGNYNKFLGFLSTNQQPKGRPGTAYQNAYLAAADTAGNIAWINNFTGDTTTGAYFMQKSCGGVINCLGYSSAGISVNSNRISRNYAGNYILSYDPTNHNCQPQICPVTVNTWRAVYDTIFLYDTLQTYAHRLVVDSFTLTGSINSIDTIYIFDTLAGTNHLQHIHTVSNVTNYPTYDSNLAINYVNYVDSVVYFDTLITVHNTTYIDTMRITKTVTGIQTLNGTDALTLAIYPNPAGMRAQVAYNLPNAGPVSIILYNNLGQQVRVLFNGSQQPGAYTIGFSATGLSAGNYQLVLSTAGKIVTRDVVLMGR